MAISETIALSASTITVGQSIVATVTITNSGASAVNVTQFVPTCVPHSATNGSVAVGLGSPNIGPGMALSVAGSNGTLPISFSVAPYAPPNESNPAMPTSYQYDVGCIVYTSDGSVTSPSVGVLTVNHYP